MSKKYVGYLTGKKCKCGEELRVTKLAQKLWCGKCRIYSTKVTDKVIKDVKKKRPNCKIGKQKKHRNFLYRGID